MINLTTDSLITLVGTVITIISMVVAIRQASAARNYRQQIKYDIRKIELAKCAEQMRKALDNSRSLPINYNNIPRGKNILDLIESIKAQLDYSIGVLSHEDSDKKIRTSLVNAQKKLDNYELNFQSKKIHASDVTELRIYIQDSISSSNTMLYGLEEK